MNLLNISGQSEDILSTYDSEPISKLTNMKNNIWIYQHAKFMVQFLVLLLLYSGLSKQQEIFKTFKNILNNGTYFKL